MHKLLRPLESEHHAVIQELCDVLTQAMAAVAKLPLSSDLSASMRVLPWVARYSSAITASSLLSWEPSTRQTAPSSVLCEDIVHQMRDRSVSICVYVYVSSRDVVPSV